jgi:hypothetical protein
MNEMRYWNGANFRKKAEVSPQVPFFKYRYVLLRKKTEFSNNLRNKLYSKQFASV